jgi:hypothetical protein
MMSADFERLAEVRAMLAGARAWRRCMRRECSAWTRGEFCPLHDPVRLEPGEPLGRRPQKLGQPRGGRRLAVGKKGVRR